MNQLKLILNEIGLAGMNGLYCSSGKERAVVNTVMNHRFQ
jgi:hypothetical protein